MKSDILHHPKDALNLNSDDILVYPFPPAIKMTASKESCPQGKIPSHLFQRSLKDLPGRWENTGKSSSHRQRLLLSAGEKSHLFQLQQAIWGTGQRQEKTPPICSAQYILWGSWQLAQLLLLMDNHACAKANPVFSSLPGGPEIGNKTLQQWRGRSLRL